MHAQYKIDTSIDMVEIDIDILISMQCLQLSAALLAFLRPTPPPSESIAAAIRRLRAIGAIEDDGVALVVVTENTNKWITSDAFIGFIVCIGFLG